MIPLPSDPVRGQPLRVDLMREIIATLRRLRPIAGSGVMLQETLNGVVFTTTATPASASVSDFDFRFKVTASQESKTVEGSSEPVTQWVLTIQPGSLWEVADPLANERAFTMLQGVTADATNGGWKVEGASSGSLFIARMTKGEDKAAANGSSQDSSSQDSSSQDSSSSATENTDTSSSGESSSQDSSSSSSEDDEEIGEGFKLCFGSDTTKALFVIADVEFSSSSSAPKIAQRVLGDVYFFPASAATLPEGLTIYGKVNFDYDAATFTQDVLKWRQAKNAFVKEGEESVMHFDKQEVEFVKEVSVGKADVADSSTSSGSSSVDALRAIVRKGTRWGLTPPAEDASSTTVLLQFAPHEADEKTPYSGSSDSSEEADNP